MDYESLQGTYGNQLSTDYELLWVLIRQGFRILGYITEEVAWQVPVSVWFVDGRHGIGYPGCGYESLKKGKESFMADCKRVELRFVTPQKQA